jgi:hypothetical protein
VSCIESIGRARRAAICLAALGLLLASCGPRPPAVPSGPVVVAPTPLPPARPLPPPERSRSIAQLREQAALRLIEANAGRIYMGRVPDVLLAIPVLEIELNADGSVRRIEVLREPRQAKDTIQLAIDAVRRAAPFGDVSHLPRPWKFTETFLFNDDRHFKPRSLDK